MKRILIMITMFAIVATSVFTLNDKTIGRIEGNDGKYIKVYINEKSNIYLETDTRRTFHLSDGSLIRFIKLVKLNLELVEVGKSSELKYRRDSGQLWAAVPSNMFVQFEYYCSAEGSSTISLIITDLIGEERLTFKSDQIEKLLSLINDGLNEKKGIISQIDKFNVIVAKAQTY